MKTDIQPLAKMKPDDYLQARIYIAQTAQTIHPTDPSDSFFYGLRVVLHEQV